MTRTSGSAWRCARNDAGTAVLNAMWVAPEGRGQGAARSLCDACADWAKAHGFDALDVEVFPDNAPARRMYEAAGFEAVGEADGLAGAQANAVAREAPSWATIAWTRALSAATFIPTTFAISRGAGAGQAHGEDRPVARVQPRRRAGLLARPDRRQHALAAHGAQQLARVGGLVDARRRRRRPRPRAGTRATGRTRRGGRACAAPRA